MREKLNKGLFFGLVGNVLFLAFGIICLVYYTTYSSDSVFSKLLEAIAYLAEFAGFGILIFSDVLLCQSIRMRRLLKIGFSAYIVLEAIMMILELNSFRIEFYEPYSLALAISHAIVSALVCFAFLQFDPENTQLEIVVVVCVGIILVGMLGNIIGVRIYFSIIINALGFSALFWSVKYLLDREEIEIDCHGDRARVAEYNSTMFEKDK